MSLTSPRRLITCIESPLHSTSLVIAYRTSIEQHIPSKSSPTHLAALKQPTNYNIHASSMMASLFSYFGGGGAARKPNQSKEAIVKLRQQLEMLKKREIHTEKQMLEQDAIARKNITTNKTGQSYFHFPRL